MIIVCQSVEHPSYPEYNNKWRVKNYWSCIVIKPHEDFDKVCYKKKKMILLCTILILYNIDNCTHNHYFQNNINILIMKY